MSLSITRLIKQQHMTRGTTIYASASCSGFVVQLLLLLLPIMMTRCTVASQLTSTFYAKSCPNVDEIVQSVVKAAVKADPRMAASLLRLHFHDCFVNGCDASVLLDGSSGEKFARPNNGSLRGFEVIDSIKTQVEKACRASVSCADILALAARDSVVQAGGPSWKVLLGRRDSITAASQAAVTSALPAPFDPLSTIVAKFQAVDLTVQDVAVLSGAHTFGRARCVSFSSRLYNFSGTGQPDPTIDATFLKVLQRTCPQSTGANPNGITPLDPITKDRFDNKYFVDLQKQQGVLLSDQELLSTSGASTASYVNSFASDHSAFFTSFMASMVSMGNIRPLMGTQGQVRLNCRVANS